MTERMSLFFTGGKMEVNNIINIISMPQNNEVQQEGFRFYMDKFLNLKNNISPIDQKQINLLELTKNILIKNFKEKNLVEFPLFMTAYQICLYIHARNNKIGINLSSNSGIHDIYDIKTEEDFIKHSYIYFEQCVPYFGKTCAFGIKSFLDVLFLHNRFIIGIGLNCYPAHGGIYDGRPYEFFSHDYNLPR